LSAQSPGLPSSYLGAATIQYLNVAYEQRAAQFLKIEITILNRQLNKMFEVLTRC